MSERDKKAVNDVTTSSVDVGQLIDMKWKLGMAVSSDECKHLNSPYITLMMTVTDSSGKVGNHSLEMTTAQFFNFSRQLKDIAALMETV
ncbi:COMM domain-containing protein 6-like [Gigantopelta aegis]|uniref:COMM domain-containing protein 6-like n=1 Tax=Gigantopelta aegis TaxID=1735272 RepID=UPI001B889198|nr:COMM domain-containing protein 6-like [Gigantopelta aegis]XP_041358655.1 COMM domain-containing protein 6-like [Gigantopelta aegis]XP_041358656.1 COMM domain-containing protein 6-like [Gigantopelta aegis]XP_041358658.1 COMM domain-containing protein 6-like [Gigantopelta aegis]XP_041358659.1 COMM domain-containing protein 6-like [Gigantopelta aegis]